MQPREEAKAELMKALETLDFYGDPRFYELLGKLAALHSRKNHDYAGECTPLRNFYKCTELGIDPFMGILVRLTDKWSRIESFAKNKLLMVADESVEDTLLDNAVYSLLAIIVRREQLGEAATEADATPLRFKQDD